MTIELTITAQGRFDATWDAYNALKMGDVKVTDWPTPTRRGAYKHMQLEINDVPPDQVANVGAAVVRVARDTGSGVWMFTYSGNWCFHVSLSFYDAVTEAAK